MWELKKEIETRKENLILILKNKKDSLEIEKQHQIYGAIKELDHIIRLMEQYREAEIFNKPSHLNVQALPEGIMRAEEEEEEEGTGPEKTSTLKLVSEKVRKFKSPIRIRFAKNDA